MSKLLCAETHAKLKVFALTIRGVTMVEGIPMLCLATQTLNPQPSTPNPQTLNPPPPTLNLQPSTINLQPSTLNPQPSTLKPSTLNPPPSTLHPQPLTHPLTPTTSTKPPHLPEPSSVTDTPLRNRQIIVSRMYCKNQYETVIFNESCGCAKAKVLSLANKS